MTEGKDAVSRGGDVFREEAGHGPGQAKLRRGAGVLQRKSQIQVKAAFLEEKKGLWAVEYGSMMLGQKRALRALFIFLFTIPSDMEDWSKEKPPRSSHHPDVSCVGCSAGRS